MHKNRNLVKNVVGISAAFTSSAVVGTAINALVPLANLTPVGKVVQVLGRFFIGGAVGMEAEKYAKNAVDDLYEAFDELR